MRILTPVIIFTLFITGCSTFQVYDKDDKQKEGVPFYIKKGVVKQVSSYTRTWIEVNLEYFDLKDGDKIINSKRSASYILSPTTYHKNALLFALYSSEQAQGANSFFAIVRDFETELNSQCGDSDTNCVLTQGEIDKESSISITSTSKLIQSLESNSSTPETIVDYENIYYFNGVIPPFGTSTATIKLASDGTMSESSTTVDATKLADMIPLKDLLLDKLGLGEIIDAAEGVTGTEKGKPTFPNSFKQKPYSLSISASTSGYKYDLTKYHSALELNNPVLGFSTEGVSIKRIKFIDSPKEEKKEESDKNTIKLTGAIVLPKEE